MANKGKKREWLSFDKARAFTRQLDVWTHSEWWKYCASGDRPSFIPSNPQTVYEEWVSWRDWLGTEYWSFEKARAFARNLGCSSFYDWREYLQSGDRPRNVPYNPDLYFDEWVSWEDWLDVECHRKKQFLPFEEAREIARKLQLPSQSEWFHHWRLRKRPEDIPANPNQVYCGKGWISWGDWLGTWNIHPTCKRFLSFEEARKFVRGLGLTSRTAWLSYCKSGNRPDNIPSIPERIYENSGWLSYYDWLGAGHVYFPRGHYLPFEEAREFARSLKLSSLVEWRKCYDEGKIPDTIPRRPESSYKDRGWISAYDWLGGGLLTANLKSTKTYKKI